MVSLERPCRCRRAGRQLEKTVCEANRVGYRAVEGDGPVAERAWSGGVVSRVARASWNPV